MGLTIGEKNSVRKTYGETLAELGKTREDIVVIDADLSCSTQTQVFAKAFPENFQYAIVVVVEVFVEL